MIAYYGKNQTLETNVAASIIKKARSKITEHAKNDKYKDIAGFEKLIKYMKEESGSIVITEDLINDIKKVEAEYYDVIVLVLSIKVLSVQNPKRNRELQMAFHCWESIIRLSKEDKVKKRVPYLQIENRRNLMEFEESRQGSFAQNPCQALIGIHRILMPLLNFFTMKVLQKKHQSMKTQQTQTSSKRFRN